MSIKNITDKILYEPRNVYIYKSALGVNNNIHNELALKLKNYNCEKIGDKISIILYICNEIPKSVSEGLLSKSFINADIAELGKSQIDKLITSGEINEKMNNVIQYNTNKNIDIHYIKTLIDSISSNKYSIVGICINSFNNLESYLTKVDSNSSAKLIEDHIRIIKRNLKALAVELNLPIVTNLEFKTEYIVTNEVVII